jgi:hypothetical protein
MSVFDDPEKWRIALAKFNALHAHEFTREFRKGKTPAIFDDEPIEDAPNLVEMFERRLKKPKKRQR